MATGRVPTTANSPLTAKGDLFGYSTTQARVAVGNDGETLVADSSTSTGLRYQSNFAVGKNKIINGDLTINQRGFTSNTSGYNFDRFYNEASGGTHTITPQTFTPGAAPVAGYEATNFMRSVVSGQTTSGQYAAVAQKIEDVRTFAGQTITVSFWAKASTGTPKVSVEMQQAFGSGGSSSVFTSAPAASTLSTSWVRYTSTITIPSISGKTIGTGSSLIMFIWVSAGSSFDARANAIGLQNATLDFWGFQVEAGSVATAFQTATGTIQGELAACQRYFIRIGGNKIYEIMGVGYTDSTTETYASRTLPVTMRTTPSTTFASASLFRTNQGGGSVATGTGIAQDGNASSPNLVNFYLQYAITGVASRGAAIQANNSTSATMDISAEL